MSNNNSKYKVSRRLRRAGAILKNTAVGAVKGAGIVAGTLAAPVYIGGRIGYEKGKRARFNNVGKYHANFKSEKQRKKENREALKVASGTATATGLIAGGIAGRSTAKNQAKMIKTAASMSKAMGEKDLVRRLRLVDMSQRAFKRVIANQAIAYTGGAIAGGALGYGAYKAIKSRSDKGRKRGRYRNRK